MSELVLIIGSKVYSSWSLRPWLFLRHHGVSFKEVTIALNQADTKKNILEHSPSGRVPALRHGAVKVWESLAICEYAAEALKISAAWPADPGLRAQARSLACEMHAGFADLRNELPMDCRRPPSPQEVSDATAADIARIREIWREYRHGHAKGGPWLFGKFGIVDAMFAPVVLRFHSYAVPIDGAERDYMNTVLNMPALREWMGAAMLEMVPVAEAEPEPAPPPAKPAARQKPEQKTEASAPPAPKPQPAAKPAPAAPAASAERPAPSSASRKQVVSQDGGVKVTSFIIPD